MIQPTNGRVVWFTPGAAYAHLQADKAQPLAAIVVHVHDARKVNLTAFASSGVPRAFANVQLLQDGDTPAGDRYAEWMPFQKGQAQMTVAQDARHLADAYALPPALGMSIGNTISTAPIPVIHDAGNTTAPATPAETPSANVPQEDGGRPPDHDPPAAAPEAAPPKTEPPAA